MENSELVRRVSLGRDDARRLSFKKSLGLQQFGTRLQEELSWPGLRHCLVHQEAEENMRDAFGNARYVVNS